MDQKLTGATRPMRILVVDDHQDNADTLTQLLQLYGHDVRFTTDPLRVLAITVTWPPDLIFLDIAMPGQDGYAVARQLRATPATAGTLLVALTGHGMRKDVLEARLAGFDHHITKPMDPAQIPSLLEMLASRLPQRGGRR
jgi:CheY-like chemotaxis protein